ncbi:hypothetical protein PtA15_11A563 [Puccinia triticina]|uniref:Glutamine amidotransferase type-2 domain-containing protein n=1 Tax=Puccinia triticina TaxID=208348 RepID=A0ABY7CX55_9BASI|nr:uncharacterized protein PtA15_11A563 [Puccinia triticina]WAQ89871.1 hypothetical protein PtA15_11A563 [Puccinia triticina]
MSPPKVLIDYGCEIIVANLLHLGKFCFQFYFVRPCPVASDGWSASPSAHCRVLSSGTPISPPGFRPLAPPPRPGQGPGMGAQEDAGCCMGVVVVLSASSAGAADHSSVVRSRQRWRDPRRPIAPPLCPDGVLPRDPSPYKYPPSRARKPPSLAEHPHRARMCRSAAASPCPSSAATDRFEHRLLIFKGEPIGLSHLITKPSHSIINQAFDCRLRLDARPVNADGFGVGWYDAERADAVPCVFQAITPAWSNRNLHRLAEKIRSPLVFAHVRASTTGALSEENCHPWTYGSLLWMHNGNISGFAKIKRQLQNELSEEFFHFPQGSTDSEWAFALFLNELSKIADPKAARFGCEQLKATMLLTLAKLKRWWMEAGEAEPSRMNFALTDGHTVVATRYVTSLVEDAASLFFATGSAFQPAYKPPRRPATPSPPAFLADAHLPRPAEQYRMQKTDRREKIVLIASEPLTFEKTDWLEIPCQTLVLVTPKMNVLQFPIIDEFVNNVYKTVGRSRSS